MQPQGVQEIIEDTLRSDPWDVLVQERRCRDVSVIPSFCDNPRTYCLTLEFQKFPDDCSLKNTAAFFWNDKDEYPWASLKGVGVEAFDPHPTLDTFETSNTAIVFHTYPYHHFEEVERAELIDQGVRGRDSR